jgi:hypothetical protein
MTRKKKLPFLKYNKPLTTSKAYVVKTSTSVVEVQNKTGFEFAQFRSKSQYAPSEIKITKFKYSKEDWRFVKSNEFLESFEWRKLRYEALLKNGRQCQCCGAKPPNTVLHVDHIKPRKIHPELALDINNLQILCHECNHGKGNWDSTDFRML